MLAFFSAALATSCTDCLSAGKIWCRSLAANGTDSCIEVAAAATCVAKEQHDLVYNASVCCADQATSTACVAETLQSFCGWCPYTVQKCLYKTDTAALAAICPGPMEDGDPCSSYTTAGTCLAPACSWNAVTTTCQPTLKPSQASGVNITCPAGMTFNAASRTCQCNAGGYVNTNGSLGCTICNKTNEQLNTAQTACQCVTGYFYNASQQCIQCSAGQTQSGSTCLCDGNFATPTELTCSACAKNQKPSDDKKSCVCAKRASKEDGTCKGLAGGAIAGIVIGSVVGAGLIAFVCIWFLVIKKKKGANMSPLTGKKSSCFGKKKGSKAPQQLTSPTSPPQLILRDSVTSSGFANEEK